MCNISTVYLPKNRSFSSHIPTENSNIKMPRGKNSFVEGLDVKSEKNNTKNAL